MASIGGELLLELLVRECHNRTGAAATARVKGEAPDSTGRRRSGIEIGCCWARMPRVQRARLDYDFGNVQNPGNLVGRCELAIELDGAARLEHHARGGGAHSAWTGRVAPGVLDRLWSALERSGFPAMPPHDIPADSTIRSLGIPSGEASQRVYIEWNAAAKMPGFAEAFAILDSIVRQLSEDNVDYAPAGEPGMVSDVVRVASFPFTG